MTLDHLIFVSLLCIPFFVSGSNVSREAGWPYSDNKANITLSRHSTRRGQFDPLFLCPSDEPIEA